MPAQLRAIDALTRTFLSAPVPWSFILGAVTRGCAKAPAGKSRSAIMERTRGIVTLRAAMRLPKAGGGRYQDEGHEHQGGLP